MASSADFDAEEVIRKRKPGAFGIDLHWLVHAHGSLEIAKLCKKHHPDIPVILGGFSATYFHEELIRRPEVDFIVRGDSAEKPLLMLMNAIVNRSRSYSEIPNLVWKDEKGDVHKNPFTYVPATLNEFANNYIPAIKSALRYRDLKGLCPWKGWSSHEWWNYPITTVLTCRGCSYNCVFCGGSRAALALYCNRKAPAFRDPELVASDILRITRFTRAPVFVIGDLLQPGIEYAYTVLDGLKSRRFSNHIIFELFKPAPEEYFARLADSVENFNLEMSPDSHDEHIRALIGKRYTNREIEANIECALDSGCYRFDLFFMVGLPAQTVESVMDTVDWCGQLMERFGRRVVPFILPYSPFLDPGCIIYEQPEKFGFKILFRSFEDYRKALLAPSWKYALNYETEWMTRDEIVDCTYQACLKLNRLKKEYGHIDYATYRHTEERLKLAIRLTAMIDELIAEGDENVLNERLKLLKPEFDEMFTGVQDKEQVRWPAPKRNLRVLTILKAAMLGSR